MQLEAVEAGFDVLLSLRTKNNGCSPAVQNHPQKLYYLGGLELALFVAQAQTQALNVLQQQSHMTAALLL